MHVSFERLLNSSYLNIHHKALCDRYGKPIFKNCNLYNQPPDRLFVLFGNGGKLFLQETTHNSFALYFQGSVYSEVGGTKKGVHKRQPVIRQSESQLMKL